MQETIERIREDISSLIQANLDPNERNWGMQDGILISANEAANLIWLPIKYLEWYQREGHSWEKRVGYVSDEKTYEHFLSINP